MTITEVGIRPISGSTANIIGRGYVVFDAQFKVNNIELRVASDGRKVLRWPGYSSGIDRRGMAYPITRKLYDEAVAALSVAYETRVAASLGTGVPSDGLERGN